MKYSTSKTSPLLWPPAGCGVELIVADTLRRQCNRMPVGDNGSGKYQSKFIIIMAGGSAYNSNILSAFGVLVLQRQLLDGLPCSRNILYDLVDIFKVSLLNQSHYRLSDIRICESSTVLGEHSN